jgi:hypothetical protein
MQGLLRDEPTFSERFISYMLSRNIRIEADLVDHLFNSSEKRLARALLLLARYGDQAGPERRIPKISRRLCGDGRDHAFTRQFLYEQIQGSGVHRIQRRTHDQHIASQRRPTRLAKFTLSLVATSNPPAEYDFATRPPAPAVGAFASLALPNRGTAPRADPRSRSIAGRVAALVFALRRL